jgi:hypothetical protein
VYHGFSSADLNYMEKYNELLNRGVLNISFAQKSYYQIESPFINCSPRCRRAGPLLRCLQGCR